MYLRERSLGETNRVELLFQDRAETIKFVVKEAMRISGFDDLVSQHGDKVLLSIISCKVNEKATQIVSVRWMRHQALFTLSQRMISENILNDNVLYHSVITSVRTCVNILVSRPLSP